VDTSFHDLDSTDHLGERFLVRLAESQSAYLPVHEYSTLVQTLFSLAERYGGIEAYMLHPLDRYTGAVRVPVRPLLARVGEVWNAVGENIGFGRWLRGCSLGTLRTVARRAQIPA
jgi:hypothetical protein